MKMMDADLNREIFSGLADMEYDTAIAVYGHGLTLVGENEDECPHCGSKNVNEWQCFDCGS